MDDIAVPPQHDVMRVGVTRVYADNRVGEYAVPRVSYTANRKANVAKPDEYKEEIPEAQERDNNSEHLSSESTIFCPESAEEFDSTNLTLEMNGNSEDCTDGVRDLAASFQHAIDEETAKAKDRPPPVKPKSYKKAPPPLVAPKPKANGVKINRDHHSPTG